ncbi:hypothetical protein EMIHUDRAFT_195927 [Emiliania huxleyi CCMP1516]|uniref:EF-hand domain-containing protein n=2 Tax=Emiliania huxleyi TaxID=2903 RepID=A0A0D3J362_EMIH1|nr:hypothetical protein EMIHUDRAFT_195927 [Emiliania huxleyi CCMP1516]EOD17947.1 hypothetical protein EMIHUDRAFT_195927 [Emiliania huxleyi CCMP1516]|eukprot:XP_005770376.1 hypothetical protein EMIHUDRAFT_195927 [Emiliania huxleyi CCMP1516]
MQDDLRSGDPSRLAGSGAVASRHPRWQRGAARRLPPSLYRRPKAMAIARPPEGGVHVAGFSVAVHYGLVRKPDTSEMFSLDAWREWPTKLRVEAGFRQYDRDKDGVFGPADVAEIALTLKGERPTPRQAAAWVARGDLDGDGALNFTEFWSMTRKERAAKGEG